jgi:hypothetical protein
MLGARLIPRLRHTISVRDDRPPSKPAARRALQNNAVASAAGLQGRTGARYPIYLLLRRDDIERGLDASLYFAAAVPRAILSAIASISATTTSGATFWII